MRARSLLHVISMACCWQLDFVRAACNVATDVTPKALSPAIATLTFGYLHKDTTKDPGYRYYVSHGAGSWADWFDIAGGSTCTFNSCTDYLCKSDGTNYWTRYGDVESDGSGVWIDSDYYNPTLDTHYTNKVMKIKCNFGSPNADVFSNTMTVTSACLCNQYTVTLT